jgi:GGDEF domain-containing protein
MVKVSTEVKDQFRWTALVEALMVILTIETINRFFYPEYPGFMGIHPHPLWIVAIILPLRHPFREGLAAGLMAGSVMAWHMIANRAGGFDYSVITLFSDFLEPVLLLCTAMFIGDRIGVMRETICQLTSDLQEAGIEVTALDEKCRANHEALRLLDTRIITQMSSVLDLVKSLSSTRNMTIEEIRCDILDKIVEHISAWDTTFYSLTEKGLVETERRVAHAHRGAEAIQRVSPESDPVISEALRDRRIAFLSEFVREDDMERARGMCLMARAIMVNENRTIGVVAVHGLGFIDYNPYNFKLFDTITDLWSSTISERMAFEELSNKSIFNEELGAYNTHYFRARFKGEFERATQYSFPLSVALLDIVDFTETRQEIRRDLQSVLAKVITAEVTELDLVARYAEPSVFAIIFPGIMADEARQKMDKVLREIADFGFAPYKDNERIIELRWGVSEYVIGMAEPEEMLVIAQSDMEGV